MTALSQRSFASGEIAPSLYARVDISKYATGLRTCRNFYVMRHGGVINRPGTNFICEVKDSTKTVRLVEFVFNLSQTYVLEFGDQYMRVIKDGVQQTLATQNITAITNANPCVVTYSGSDTYANGDEVYISGIVGPIGTYLNGRNFKVVGVNTGANTFELDYMDGTNVNSTSFGAYTSGGTVEEVYTITTPYLEADLPELKFVQSADVVTIVHPSYAPRELARTGDTAWTLTTISFVPEVNTPAGLSATQNGTTGSTTYKYKVTAIDDVTFEESLPTAEYTVSNGNANLTPTNNISLSWTAVSGASNYNIYRGINDVYGLIGIAGSDAFVDIGATDPDTTDTPPTDRDLFNASGDYPSAVTFYQQRLLLANTDNDTEIIHASKTGNFYNFTSSSPIQDDDAISFTMAGRQVNEVHHMIDLGSLIVFTASGEWSIQGDSAGILSPGNINPKQYSYSGSSSRLRPIVIGNTAMYVQARGSIIRDLGYDFSADGYKGNDLTLFSAHLFDNYSINDWTYQQVPHSILWTVRDDGALLGLTYVKEQSMLAWHRHDFENGFVENCCSIPDGNEDTLYLVVKRTIDGVEKRYIEKFVTRQIVDIVDSKILDSHLSYDGRNTGSTTMTASGSGWTYTDTLTMTASAGYFSASDVGNEIHMTGADGEVVRFEITAYTSSTVVSVKPNRTVPVAMRSVATTNWSRAIDEISGLWHLEGESVSIFADGYVVANPNNAAYDMVSVENGSITLSRCYSVIHIGLPITSDLETLNIDTANGETISDKKNLVQKVTIFVENSRGIWAGSSPPPDEATDFLGGLSEVKVRSFEGYDSPVDLVTGTMDVIIQSHWNSNGRVFIRQTDPVPLSVLAIVPAGSFPFRGGG